MTVARVTGGRETPLRRAIRGLSDGRGRALLGLALAGVLLVVVSGLFNTATTPGARPPKASATPPRHAGAGARPPAAATGAPADPVLSYEAMLDQSVAAVLDQVRGAGSVSVAITVSRSPSQLLVRNLSTTRDRQGGTVSSSLDEALAYGRGQVPVSTGEAAAPIIGALVVAPGAVDPMVRAELTQGVETLLGLGANQVIVLPGRRGGS